MTNTHHPFSNRICYDYNGLNHLLNLFIKRRFEGEIIIGVMWELVRTKHGPTRYIVRTKTEVSHSDVILVIGTRLGYS